MDNLHFNLSPQRAQRTQSLALNFVLFYAKALSQRIRTRMTRIGRIFTDILNPYLSVSSVLSVFLHTKMIERISAFICVHLRLISLTETSRIINVEVQQW